MGQVQAPIVTTVTTDAKLCSMNALMVSILNKWLLFAEQPSCQFGMRLEF